MRVEGGGEGLACAVPSAGPPSRSAARDVRFRGRLNLESMLVAAAAPFCLGDLRAGSVTSCCRDASFLSPSTGWFLFFPYSPPCTRPASPAAELLKQPFRLFETTDEQIWLLFVFFFSQLSFPSPLLLFPLRLLSPPSPTPEGALITLITSGDMERGRRGLKLDELAMRHRRAAGAAAEIWCICLPMCSLAPKRARSMHTAVLVLLCFPLCVYIFAVTGRDRICFGLLFQAVLQSLYRWLFFFFGRGEQ